RGRRLASTAPTVVALTQASTGPNEGAQGELGQVGPASLAGQGGQPGDHRDAEHGQRPQRPCRHTRPPAWSGGSGRKGRGHGPRRTDALRFLVTNTSLVGHWGQCGRRPSRERY